MWDNRKRDKMLNSMDVVAYERVRLERQRGRDPSDLTDLEDLNFRYIL